MNSRQLKFSIYYFFSISIYAFILAFFPIHCKVVGLSALEIAVVTAFGTLATVLGPSIAIHLSHYYFSPRKILVYATMATTASFVPLLYTNSMYSIAFAWLCINIFKRSADSLVDTKALAIEESFSFERVRIWGSIGFMVMMAVLGPLIDIYGIKVIVPFGILLSALVMSSAIFMRNEIDLIKGKDRIISNQETNNKLPKDLLIFYSILIVSFSLITASHSAVYVYLSIYLRSLGWSASEISWTWNIGVLAEVIMFAVFYKIEKHLGLLRSLWISTLLTALRWYLLATYDQKSIIMLSQILHGFSFAACYTACVKLVAKILPPTWRDRGQGLMISIGFGVGAVFGRIISGIFADGLSSDQELSILFLISSYIALLALLLLSFLLLPSYRRDILEKKFD